MKKLKTSLIITFTIMFLLFNCIVNAETDYGTYNYTVKGTKDYDKAFEVLNLVNIERKKAGLNELKMDKVLLEVAMYRSGELVTYFSHERPNGTMCYSIIPTYYGTVGENIAMFQTSASQVVNAWMNSEGHRENILSSSYTSIGIGCFKADNGYYYWTQVFSDKTPVTPAKTQNTDVSETVSILNSRIPFYDVNKTDWYFNAVKYNVSNNIISGYNSTTFAPNDKLTRAMIVTILYRMEGSPNVSGNSKFSDVVSNEWYSKAIKWATDKGIVHGYGGTNNFGPNDNIIRQDLAGILRNYANYKKKNTNVIGNLNKYKDYKNVDSYALSAVNWAVGKGVITGNDDGTLNPKGNATRAEAAAMIQKYCNKIGR